MSEGIIHYLRTYCSKLSIHVFGIYFQRHECVVFLCTLKWAVSLFKCILVVLTLPVPIATKQNSSFGLVVVKSSMITRTLLTKWGKRYSIYISDMVFIFTQLMFMNSSQQ